MLPPVRYNYYNCDSVFFRNVRDICYRLATEVEDFDYSDIVSCTSDNSEFTDFDDDVEEWHGTMLGNHLLTMALQMFTKHICSFMHKTMTRVITPPH